MLRFVRTVKVVMRPKDSRDKSLPYVHKDLETKTVAVQRLSLVHPASVEVPVFHVNPPLPVVINDV